MNRRVVVVLACTLLAMVAASLWVPVESAVAPLPITLPSPGRYVPGSASRTYQTTLPDRYVPIWRLSNPRPALGWHPGLPAYRMRWGQLTLNLGLIAAIGGLLALVLHLRARRLQP